MQWLQFRINQYILTTNSFLFKIGKTDTKLCSLCQSNEETIVHLFWDCLHVQNLLSHFISICDGKGLHITLEEKSFILGTPNSIYLGIIFLIIKSYIYRKRCLQENLSIHELLIDLKTHITTLKYTATKQGKYNNFLNQWTDWLFLMYM